MTKQRSSDDGHQPGWIARPGWSATSFAVNRGEGAGDVCPPVERSGSPFVRFLNSAKRYQKGNGLERCVRERADNYEISWYTSWSPEGAKVCFRDGTTVQSQDHRRFSGVRCREATGCFRFRHDIGVTC